MRARRKQCSDLGEAISMEDAISMMTIIFVLFVIFLVPLVSIDKARLEAKQQDPFWDKVVNYLDQTTSGMIPLTADNYKEVFEIYDPYFVRVSDKNHNGVVYKYIEFLTPDSSLVVVRHDVNSGMFNRMDLSQHGETERYRHGEINRLNSSAEWFSIQEQSSHGTAEQSINLKRDYREWLNESMEGLNR